MASWPVGMLTAHSNFKFDMPLISILGGTLLEDASFAFVMYRRWGDLRLLIDRRMQRTDSSPFPIEQAIQLMRSIAEDMKTLHENHDILHRDLKASNVLIWGDFAEDVSLVTTSGVSEKIHTVVADFECSVGVVGTGFWRAPEILQQLRERVPCSEIEFTRASDVYSYGMTCYEIVTGCIPFGGHYNQEMVARVLLGLRPDLPQDLPEYLRDIILRCWSLDPSQRPNFSEICEMLERRRGPNPVSVSVDEEFHKDATVVKVKQWMNPQPLALLEVIQKLIHMDLRLWKAADSYEESGFCYQDFMVTDREGRKLSDKGFIEHIRKVLGIPIKIKWIAESLGEKYSMEDSFPFTSIHLSGWSKPGSLADVSKILDEMICKDSSVGIWTSTCGGACVIQLKRCTVEYAKLGLLCDRLFCTLLWHDEKEFVVWFGAREFPRFERNVLIDYSIPQRTLDASKAHISLMITKSGVHNVLAHFKCANDAQVRYVLTCFRELETLGYIVHASKTHRMFGISKKIEKIMRRAMQSHSIECGGTNICKDMVFSWECGCPQMVERALDRHSTMDMQVGVIGDESNSIIRDESNWIDGFF